MPLATRKYSWYSFLLEAEGYNAAGRIMSTKISKTALGIKPATFRLEAQCLSQLLHQGPLFNVYRVFFPGVKWHGRGVATHLHIESRVRMSGAIICSTKRFHGVDGNFTFAFILLLSSLLYNYAGYVLYIFIYIRSVWVWR